MAGLDLLFPVIVIPQFHQYVHVLLFLQDSGSRYTDHLRLTVAQLDRAVHLRLHQTGTVIALDQDLHRTGIGVQHLADVINLSRYRFIRHGYQPDFHLIQSLY